MSEQKEWNDKEVLIPSVEGIKKSSPLKEILTDQLKSFIEEESKSRRCDCHCHYDPNIMHMSACCNHTYQQYKDV